jgi:hypothetical protein
MRRVVRVLVVGVVPVVSACFSYTPLQTTSPPVGETVAFQVTDRGRVELAGRFGPGLLRIEGQVTEVDSQQVVLSVARVSQIGNGTTRWSGESVRLERDFLGIIEKRNLSPTRTALLVAVTVGGFAALASSQGLFGVFGGEDTPPIGTEPPVDNRVWGR